MEQEYFEVRGAVGQLVRGYVHLPQSEGPLPVVLLAHGFKGFADYGFLPLMARRLCEADFAVVRFSFSHCGVTGVDGDNFDRPDLFEHDSFSRQITDVLRVIDAIVLGDLPGGDRLDAARIALAGHSRGGVTSVLATGKSERIKALITLASPDKCLNDPKMREMVMRKGRVESPSGRTGQMLYVGREYIEDIEHAGDCYDLGRRMELYAHPYLAIHGESDATVSSQCSRRLAEAHGGKVTEMLLMPECGHTFNFSHGQEGSTEPLDRAIEAMALFLKANL